MIGFEDVKLSLGGAKILDGVSFNAEEGQCVSLFGPNGCGKSTLMLLLAGLLNPDAGRVRGRETLRRKIGFVFQDYRRHLLPWLDGYENVVFPLRVRGVPDAVCRERVEALVQLVGCPVDLTQKVFTLSGGQAQLISLLRALVIEPRFLILDEPFSAIDFGWTLDLRQKIMAFAHKMGLGVLMITHDLEEAVYMGRRVVFLTGRPARVYTELAVDFPWPRTPDLAGTPEFATLKLEALNIFREIWQGSWTFPRGVNVD